MKPIKVNNEKLQSFIEDCIKTNTSEGVIIKFAVPVLLGGYKVEGHKTLSTTDTAAIMDEIKRHGNESYTIVNEDHGYYDNRLYSVITLCADRCDYRLLDNENKE